MFKSFKVGDFTDQRGVNHKLNCLSWSPDAKRVAVVGTFKAVSYSSCQTIFNFYMILIHVTGHVLYLMGMLK